MAQQIAAKKSRAITEADATAAEDAAQQYWGGLRHDAYFKLLKERRKLPFHQQDVREEFLRMYQGDSQVMVVVGETGSGKSTQIPGLVMLSEHPKPGRGAIFCTQPRRIATSSIAERVAAEQGVKVGEAVGYVYRGNVHIDDNTIITYATDGTVVQRLKSGRLLSFARTVIVDEAHERTQATDILLGYLKGILPTRPDLKVIIMSATLDVAKFQGFFGGAERVPLLAVKGRTYPVTVQYSLRALKDYVNCAVRTVIEIHRGSEEGDILVFMPGKEDIALCVEAIRVENRTAQDLDVFPLFSGMDNENQRLALCGFGGSQNRRCIVATNIAETSITIDGVCHVVDTGLTKVMQYNPRLRSRTLRITPYSKANATQRAGRAGRTAPGTCYRLYAREDFDRLLDKPRTQISQSEAGNTILTLLALGVESIWKFNFIDPPAAESMYEELSDLGCVGVDGKLTPLGRNAAALPLPPHQAVALCKASISGCTKDIAQIISILSVDTIYSIPPSRDREARQLAFKTLDALAHPYGDHMTLYFIWKRFEEQHGKTCVPAKCTEPVSWHTELARWCKEHSLDCNALLKVQVFLLELEQYMDKLDLAWTHVADPFARETPEILLRALLEGYFIKLAVRSEGDTAEYLTLAEAQPGLLHPENPSAVRTEIYFARNDQFDIVMYDDFFLQGPKQYFLSASGVDSQWIFESDSARAYADEIIKMQNEAVGKTKGLPGRRLAAAKDKFERSGRNSRHRHQGAPVS